MERSLVLIKPDGVARGYIGDIVGRFEKRGLVISKMEMMTLSRQKAATHYAEHVEKPFYPPLIDFITSGPLVALVISGDRAISIIRSMCGTTDAGLAAPGTIRGDLSIYNNRNVVHSSDSVENAEREIGIFFG